MEQARTNPFPSRNSRENAFWEGLGYVKKGPSVGEEEFIGHEQSLREILEVGKFRIGTEEFRP